jgi:hypothetical protein
MANLKKLLNERTFSNGMSKALLLLWMVPALLVGGGDSSDEYTYRNQSIIEVIRDIESRTPWRFLYRDALLAGKRISFYANEQNLLSVLEQELLATDIYLRTDPARYQVFLFERRRQDTGQAMFQGRVVDAQTGGSLPFATVQYKSGGRVYGVAANDDGLFRIGAEQLFRHQEETILTVSYVGYSTAGIRAEKHATSRPVTIRLYPLAYSSNDVVITGSFLNAGADTMWAGINANSSGYGFGGQNAIRSLGVLPSVGISGGFSNGLNVRGSKSDAMDVLLDGMSIYNHHHFFGLMDAFNPDVLRAVGFYYNIAPAHFSGPPGATLSFLTRTGSQQKVAGTAGLSSTAIRGSLEGPAGNGRGSWLVAGRYSLIGEVDWLSNQSLLQWGLDINRPNSSELSQQNFDNRIVFPKDGYGRFYDIHLKGYYEFNGGRRLTVSGYSGGNEARQTSDRIFRIGVPGNPQQNIRMEIREVNTSNNWGNHAVSVRLQQPFTPSSYLTTTAGFSWFDFEYLKDDFTYNRALSGQGGIQTFIGPFRNSNALLDIRFNQLADISLRGGAMLSAGHTFHQYRISYTEDNAFSPEFEQLKLAWQWDHYLHYTHRLSSELEISGGLRTHYFSDGGYLRFSPRTEITLHTRKNLSFKAGYSRNYQFLHSLSIDQYVMSDFWVISNKEYGPSQSDNLIAGVYYRPAAGHYMQAEAYVKQFENLRLPKINARALSGQVDFEETPWFNNNSAVSRGLEFLYRMDVLSDAVFTAGYTLSQTEYQNRLLNQGRKYHPEWDRTHQLHIRGDWFASGPLSGFTGLTVATGSSNPLSYVLPDEPERTGNYFRVDAGMAWKHNFEYSALEVRINVFNMLNRKNPLYRKQMLFRTEQGNTTRLQSEIVDVFDLGIIPSFDILFRF